MSPKTEVVAPPAVAPPAVPPDKRKIRMGRFRPRRGFTLVETVAALAVAGILLAAAIGIFAAGSRLALRTDERFAEQTMAQQIEARVKREVQYAGGVSLYRNAGDAAAAGEHSLYYLAGSGLMMDGGSVLAPESGYDCRLTFGGAGGRTLVATVTVTSRRDPAGTFRAVQDIPLPNLPHNGDAAHRTITAAGDSDWEKIGFTDFTPPAA